ncbi:methylated-DNA--[protein]-cysteine S-methyltransferase [Pleionea sediminis]|uniref:methylated-DNA--[protein]-cysteine S-methyltransferase n=1 Tax=Pleionea sediminis TaxID=2569479 RepID=UPI00197B3908|nr:methylated-DNA--[protein]-cysteine S-methyltransferase [Pleionea sediminis]
MIFIDYYESPIGTIELTANTNGLTGLYFSEERQNTNINSLLQQTKKQLSEYFLGKRKDFSIELNTDGTCFQQQVWKNLRQVKYGKTISYQTLANTINRPKAVRAVGAANGKNPISIIIPCHRVIGSNGKLTGYAGGLERKEWLLNHEKAI